MQLGIGWSDLALPLGLQVEEGAKILALNLPQWLVAATEMVVDETQPVLSA